MKRLLTIMLTALAAILSIHSYAQPSDVAGRPVRAIGLYSSLKGIGIQCDLPGKDKDEFISLTAFVEMYGIPTGRCSEPGGKFNFSHNFIFKTLETEDAAFRLYAGPGISTGYMRDFEVGQRVDKDLVLQRSPGVMTALSGRAGCLFLFDKRISLDISFTAELGLIARLDDEKNGLNARLYRNGLMQCFYPELSILVSL